ncbi:hypothetical protein D3C71_1456260 [compost metagenome]
MSRGFTTVKSPSRPLHGSCRHCSVGATATEPSLRSRCWPKPNGRAPDSMSLSGPCSSAAFWPMHDLHWSRCSTMFDAVGKTSHRRMELARFRRLTRTSACLRKARQTSLLAPHTRRMLEPRLGALQMPMRFVKFSRSFVPSRAEWQARMLSRSRR